MTHLPAALLYRLIHDAYGEVLIANEDDASDPSAALDLAQEKLEEAMDLILRWDDLARGLSSAMDTSGTIADLEPGA